MRKRGEEWWTECELPKTGFVWIKVILLETLQRVLCALKEKQSPVTKCSERGRAKRSSEKCSDFGSCFWLYWVECVHSTSKNEVMSNWNFTIWGQSAKHSILCAGLCLLKLLTNRASAVALMTSVLWACRAVRGRGRGIKHSEILICSWLRRFFVILQYEVFIMKRGYQCCETWKTSSTLPWLFVCIL